MVNKVAEKKEKEDEKKREKHVASTNKTSED